GHMESAMNINAAEFKAKCLKLIDEVAATHEPLVITKRGKPVARVVPIEDEAPTPGLFGYMKGTGKNSSATSSTCRTNPGPPRRARKITCICP
ncbi:prevent-host-death family protein, partial [mine drainage metagenome]